MSRSHIVPKTNSNDNGDVQTSYPQATPKIVSQEGRVRADHFSPELFRSRETHGGPPESAQIASTLRDPRLS